MLSTAISPTCPHNMVNFGPLGGSCPLGNFASHKIHFVSKSGHRRTTLLGYVFTTKPCIGNRKKNLFSINISSTCPHSMVNFGPLVAEIVSLVWGTLANFNGFCHLYLARRPSSWALAHISGCICIITCMCRIVTW